MGVWEGVATEPSCFQHQRRSSAMELLVFGVAARCLGTSLLFASEFGKVRRRESNNSCEMRTTSCV